MERVWKSREKLRDQSEAAPSLGADQNVQALLLPLARSLAPVHLVSAAGGMALKGTFSLRAPCRLSWTLGVVDNFRRQRKRNPDAYPHNQTSEGYIDSGEL